MWLRGLFAFHPYGPGLTALPARLNTDQLTHCIASKTEYRSVDSLHCQQDWIQISWLTALPARLNTDQLTHCIASKTEYRSVGALHCQQDWIQISWIKSNLLLCDRLTVLHQSHDSSHKLELKTLKNSMSKPAACTLTSLCSYLLHEVAVGGYILQ